MSPEEEAAYRKGYEQARTDMFRELAQLTEYYFDNNKRTGGNALVHARTVLRSMKPNQKPWNLQNV
ncbi:hypothetical protein C4565_08360 [Candidatus Parcubacteria bacterium]|nr:MAG: hypothetical protein C4565_08360 [Candidatus Parcubacteria bacterium]